LDRRLGGPRNGLEDMEKRTFLTVLDSNSDSSIVQPADGRYTEWVTAALIISGYRNRYIHRKQEQAAIKVT
jgi:hypothetical protein